ncbi:hypothetical protein [Maliponia aquimaris]|uniref:Uncharacterized protein n=1 Tax=Maliponia aquimaris TaxID=1673631 RepID=A0A238K7Y1_9RHOB|nr:hypothetical protein [Maliponia aquimaris]SMX38998.1 hypothetical protein MAA8898_01828 [Maliponia aquimaris]
MDKAQTSFHRREQALRRKHVRMSQGYVTKLDRNGLIVQVPDNKIGGFGLGLLLRAVLILMVIKVMTLVWLGEPRYQAHVDVLSQGALYERAGAWVMQVDPVTRKLAALLTPTPG